jgi:integrase
MARPNKPWYRKDRDVWVVRIKGKQVVLAKGKGKKAEALKAFYGLMLGNTVCERATVKAVADLCLSHLRNIDAPYEIQTTYRRFLSKLVADMGDLNANLATPVLIEEWMHRKEWAASARNTATRIYKRAWRRAEKEGLLRANPMDGMEISPDRLAEVLINADGVLAMFDEIRDPRFRDIITFIHETGCRVGEARKLEARHLSIDGYVATFLGKTTSATGKARRIYMNQRAREIALRLSEANQWADLPEQAE